MMILNVFPNYFRRYLITYGTNEISVFPKFSSPKLSLYFRMLLENHAGTNALKHTHNSRDAIPRRKRQKYMNMICRNFQCVYLKLMICGNLLKNILYSLPYISMQYQFPILRSPYQMIFGVIYRMTGSSQCHAICIACSGLPPAGKLFIPVYKTGYSSFNIS